LRLCFAASHYRNQLEYDENHIAQAEQVLERLRTVYNQFRSLQTTLKPSNSLGSDVARRIIYQSKMDFDGAMDDDFNTPRALAAMIGFAKSIEPYANDKLNQEVIVEALNLFSYFGNVFGILRSKGTGMESVFEKLLAMVLSIRDESRRIGNWERSDMIRNSLRELGVVVEDSADGVRWHLRTVAERSA